MNSYWYRCPRGFGNEYTIAIATNKAQADAYVDADFTRINRSKALSWMSERGDNATKMYVTLEVDGNSEDYHRFDVARAIRLGLPIERHALRWLVR